MESVILTLQGIEPNYHTNLCNYSIFLVYKMLYYTYSLILFEY